MAGSRFYSENKFRPAMKAYAEAKVNKYNYRDLV